MHATDVADYDLSQLTSGHLYFYVGAGLSQSSGLIGWKGLVRAVHRYRKQYEGWDGGPPVASDAEANSKYLQDFVSQTGRDAKPILSKTSTDSRRFGRAVLLNVLFRHDALTESPAHNLGLQERLWACRAHGVLTTNYDTLIERACPVEMTGKLRVYRHAAAFLPYILSNPVFVMKLHGDVNDLGTIVLDPRSAWMSKGVFPQRLKRWLRKLYRTIAETGHVVFLGVGFRDETIRQLDRALRTARLSERFKRIALVPASQLRGPSELSRARRAGVFSSVTFLTYTGDALIAYERFLQALASARANATSLWPQCDEARDISRNVFLRRPFPRKRRWNTTPWTIDSTPRGAGE